MDYPDYHEHRQSDYFQKCTLVWALVVIVVIFAIVLFCILVSHGMAKADIVSVAQAEIGHGEIGGNNKGAYVRQYLNGQEGLPWCAGFVSYCLKEAGMDIIYTLRAKSFLGIGKRLAKTELRPGDLAVFSRKGGGHVGIIEKLDGQGFISIEGNVGEYPAKVRRIRHGFPEQSICGFVRIK